MNADKDILPAAWLFQFYVDRSNTICILPDKAGRNSNNGRSNISPHGTRDGYIGFCSAVPHGRSPCY
ncbi:Uncharacterized protein HZ326_15729 [Fusarium oxysporum f. sp. albedinis]|nr:Uncharacterized protein HZ326_15729 [Fusarium oxysporum f. sp. albedinis]